MKKIIAGLLLVWLGYGTAQAVTQSTSTVVKVTCAPGLSISIDVPEIDFQNMDPGESRIFETSATITNDSKGRTADYTIDCSTFTTPTSGEGFWLIDPDGNPQDDMFSLQAIFKSSAPAAGDFTSNEFLDDQATPQNMEDPSFTMDSSGYDGNNIPKNTQRLLWFRMHTPANTSTQEEQNINVTITAEDARTF